VALDGWQQVIERDERHPQPIVRAAIRWLRRNPPKPAVKFRSCMATIAPATSRMTGADRFCDPRLEMAHLGDPWKTSHGASTRCESFRRAPRGRNDSETEAIAIWERESGLRVDPATLAWWRLFSTVKGCAIWTTSGKEFVASGNDLVLGFAGTYSARRHDRIMADLLERLVEEGWS
jgi:hypothetical protein